MAKIVERKKSAILNPYKINPDDVTTRHFYDARLYDSSIQHEGWSVSRDQARSEYKKWLSYIRQKPEMNRFRKTSFERKEFELDGGHIIFNKTDGVPNHSVTIDKHVSNHHHPAYSQSKEKGVKVDDIEYVPKMFTEKMGREISHLRNNQKMTQAMLAKKLNVDTNMIRNIELGGIISFNSNDLFVKNLAKVLDVPSIRYQI